MYSSFSFAPPPGRQPSHTAADATGDTTPRGTARFAGAPRAFRPEAVAAPAEHAAPRDVAVPQADGEP